MKVEKWICTHCSEDSPCILTIPRDSSAVPFKCPMSSNDEAKPNWKIFDKDNNKIVNISLKGVTKFSYDGNINIEIPEDVIINFECGK